jgi:hypothetical protein
MRPSSFLTASTGLREPLIQCPASAQEPGSASAPAPDPALLRYLNRDIGFLPGDIKSKVEPYMQPLHDNLSVIQHQFSESAQEYVKITELLGRMTLEEKLGQLQQLDGNFDGKVHTIDGRVP